MRRAAAFFALLALGGCASTRIEPTGDRPLKIVASANFWGSIAADLGGERAQVRSLITDPRDDPHLYESGADDAAALSRADLVITNGLGYDAGIEKLLPNTNKRGRVELTVANVLGAADGANPHLWYDVTRLGEVARAIVAALIRLDTGHRVEYENNLAAFERKAETLAAAVNDIRTAHRGARVAYTEPLAEYLLRAAGLAIETPEGFAHALEEGNEPGPRDTKTMRDLIIGRRIQALVYNAQATSPVTEQMLELARDNDVPVVPLTETLPESDENYVAWQRRQLQELQAALGKPS